jgi:hypothetical protein
MILRDGAILLSEAAGWADTSSDEDKVFEIVALNEIYNFVVENFLN